MAQSSEMTGVEIPAIKFLQQMGWEYRKGNEIEVSSRTLAPILQDHFARALKKINPWIDEMGIEKALRELRKINEESLMLSNQLFWEAFIQKSSFQLTHTQNGHTEYRSVQFIDSITPANNTFCVVNQFVGKNAADDQFRPDLLLFVNGLPLGIIECKASHEKLGNAISQLLGYQNTFPRHFYFNQVCAAINRSGAKYGTIGTPAKFYFDYRLEECEEAEVVKLTGESPNAQQKLLWALFQPDRFIQLVRHFVLFEQGENGLIKKLPRYQQWRTVIKTIANIKDDKGGVVWHTQGSGKSLTMGMLARMLRTEEVGLDNPSILLLTDRTDLDQQIFNTFTNIGLHPEKAHSVEGLQQRLSNDYGGIFTSTIQKFQERKENSEKVEEKTGNVLNIDPKTQYGKREGKTDTDTQLAAEAITRYQRIKKGEQWIMRRQRINEKGEWVTEEELEINFQVLSTKKNFYVLVDEAHRSHYGFLGAFLRESLPHSKMIAFTGTPLSKEDKNTLKEFGGQDYIDTYTLQEAVRDEFILPIKYLDGIAEQTVDGLLDKDFEEKTKGVSVSKQGLMRQKLLKERRRHTGRLQAIAEHLVTHYEQNGYAKGFKAMLVCDGRPAAVAYKEILDEIMAKRAIEGKPVFESRVVISLNSITKSRSNGNREDQADGEDTVEVQSIEERVRAAVNAGETPIAVPADEIPKLTNALFKLPFGDESENTDQKTKFNNVALLIVSDMLLTGYDAPILSTLYLDKPLREHTLLQAIARVNRTRDGKNAGYIVDYYGIVPHLDQALETYDGAVKPSEVWEGPEAEIPKLQAACESILSLLPKRYDLETEPEKYKEDAEKKLDPISHLDLVEDFLEALAKFNALLDIVLPDPAGAPFKPYFKVFNELKLTVRNLLSDEEHQEAVTAEESRMLAQLIEDHISVDPVMSLLKNEVDIFNREEFDHLKRLSTSKAALTAKNKLKTTIQVGLQKNPGFFGKLEEELKRLLDEEKEGRLEQIAFLEQIEGLINRIRNKDQDAQNSGFESVEEVAVYNYLKEHTEQMAAEITRNLFSLSDFCLTLKSPNWHRTPTVVEELEKLVRKQLKGVAGWERSTTKQHAKQIVIRLKTE